MSSIECPYYGSDCGTPDENSPEGEFNKFECEKCNKNFVYQCEYSVSYYSQKADCLNGGEHRLRAMCGVPEEFFEGKFECELCGKKEVRR